MEFQKLKCIIVMLCLKASIQRKFVSQNEMSEHCRRQVVPSVFLGRQVADSSAQVMHFSRLDLPYSCSISVRTESGSNIILVILSTPGIRITTSCTKGNEQLLVYEMGETFGGYWGALPESVFQQETHNYSTYYTLKSAVPLSKTITLGPTDYDEIGYTEEIVSPTTPEDATGHDYIVMEVPLVNVSGKLELSGSKTKMTPGDEDELFDLIYDVTPKNGVLYETSIMPLVQFSIWKQNGRRYGLEEPRYQLDYNMHGFTQDYRLMLSTHNRKSKISNRPYHATKRIKFKKKNKKLFSVMRWPSRFYSPAEYTTELTKTTTLRIVEPLDSSLKTHTDTWQLLDKYLNLLNTSNLATSHENMDDEALAILKRISNMKHNASVYLQPKLLYSQFYSPSTLDNKYILTNEIISNYVTRNFSSTRSFRINTPLKRINSTLDFNLVNNMSTLTVNMETQTDNTSRNTTSPIKNEQQEFTTDIIMPSVINHEQRLGTQSKPIPNHSQSDSFNATITENRRKSESGSLVDHESWENIVQVAPVMADLLNLTTAITHNNIAFSEKSIKQTPSVWPEKQDIRKKRYIQALSIEHHRPQQITTREDTPLPDKNLYEFDSHQLAEVVELQDDEIQGRVALHYFKNYAGATIFNMCDYNNGKVTQVYIFNSSRIVIAINNFTMDHITIIMTESRVAQTSGCPPSHIECQVSGVRVCVHKMNACDGLPNCGSYDIYDEDRLLCGSTVGFHYTVCLAACTFLVVLLTLLYSVHYWIKRCVPKVSEAFFVYTDKSENILYLDTIMRSPTELEGSSRMVYHSSFFDDDDLSTASLKHDNRKVFNVLRRFLRFLVCKKPKRYSHDIVQQNAPSSVYFETRRKFSFTERELFKIVPTTRNASNQTGDSLEMAYLKQIKHRGLAATANQNKKTVKEPPISNKKTIHLMQSEKELTSLRRLRNISQTLPSSSKHYSNLELKQNEQSPPADEEVELQSTLYDHDHKIPKLGGHVLHTAKYEIHPEPLEQKRLATKHLRFEEGATAIEPSADQHDDKNDDEEQRKTNANTHKFGKIDSDLIEEDEEAASSSGRDFRRFWGKGKKKKTQLSLR